MKNTKKNKKIFGFTLAELLLALSIVGIVAAVVLPGIKNIQPDREAIVLKKGYMTLTRTISSMIINDDLYPEVSDNSLISSNFANTHAVSYRGATYSGNTKFCELFMAHVNVKGIPDGCSFSTTDGIDWTITNENSSQENYSNIVSFTSRDTAGTFDFKVNKYGKVEPYNFTSDMKYILQKTDLTKE